MNPTLANALTYHLTHDAGVSVIVGQRVYAKGEVPQGAALPMVLFEVTNQDHECWFGGGGGLVNVNLQITGTAIASTTRNRLASALREALDVNLPGALMGNPSAPLEVPFCNIASEFDQTNPPEPGAEKGSFDVIQQYEVWHAESTTGNYPSGSGS